MNKRKMFIYVFLIMSAIFLITEQVYASTTPDNYNNYAYPMSKYKTLRETSFSLYTSGQTESIDPASGNLELRYTDLYLKGKNGLDFELARYYSLENANFWEPNVESSQLILVFYVQGYYITGTETREKYVNGILTETTTTPVYFCDGDENIVDDYDVMDTNFPNFIYEKYWKHSQHAQYMADKFNNGDFDRIEEYISGKDSVIEVIKYSEQADFNVQIRYQLTGAGNAVFNYQIGYTVYRNSNTAVEKFFNLGAGWAFDFPYIERRGDEDHYLHYGSKGTLYFNHNVNDWAYVHSRLPSGFQHIYGVTLEGYSLSDIKLYHVYGKDLYSNGQEREYFRLVEKGGKTLYFAMDGELLGIKDRFGNEIRFLHTGLDP